MKLAVLCSCNVEVLVHAVQKALCMPVCAAYKAPGSVVLHCPALLEGALDLRVKPMKSIICLSVGSCNA
jgi:hypothetical protein